MVKYANRSIRQRWLVVGKPGTEFIATDSEFVDCIFENHGVGHVSFLRCDFTDCTFTGPGWPAGLRRE